MPNNRRKDSRVILETRRLTSSFLQAVPANVKRFDAYLYAIVRRKTGLDQPTRWGRDCRIDPCILDWDTKTITMRIPTNINTGIESLDDLDPNFYESVEAAFLSLLHSCAP